jgi:hypothetical protein
MNYIIGKDRMQVSVECIEDYVEINSEVRVIDNVIEFIKIINLHLKTDILMSVFVLYN